MRLPTIRCLLIAWSVCAGVAHAADGDLDTSFSGDGIRTADLGFGGQSTELIGGHGSDFFLAGTLYGGNGTDFVVTKFKGSGVPHIAFGQFGRREISYDVANGVDVLLGMFPQPDGSLLLAGSADTDPTQPDSVPAVLLRLTDDGDVDTTFGNDGWIVADYPPDGFYHLVNAATRDADGNILFAGMCFDCGAPDVMGVTVLRMSPDGAPDPAFGGDGWGLATFEKELSVLDMSVDRQGRVVVLCNVQVPDDFGSYRDEALVVRFTQAGVLDASFGTGGSTMLEDLPRVEFETWYAYAVASDADGATLLAVYGYDRSGIVRLDPDGHVDPTFGDGGLSNLWRENGVTLHDVMVRSDRRILTTGRIRGDDDEIDTFVARLHPDGTRDASFAGNGLLRVDAAPDEEDSGFRVAHVSGRLMIAGAVGFNDPLAALVRLEDRLVFLDGLE